MSTRKLGTHNVLWEYCESFKGFVTRLVALLSVFHKQCYDVLVDLVECHLPLHDQSHSESFFILFENRFGRILDEPEAALSPQRQMSFIALLHRLVLTGSQFIIATHSPIILAYPYAWLYSFDQSPPARVQYEETEHYQVTKMFLSFKDKMLKELLKVDEEEMGTVEKKPRRKRGK